MHPLSRLVMLAAGFTSPALAQTAPPPATPPTPPCSAPEYRQLDFWVGEWDLEFTNPDGTIGRAENRITTDEQGDCVISEHFRQPGGGPGGSDYTGASYSIYDAQTRSWRQLWVDNGGGMFDLRGGPVSGERHVFALTTIEPRGPNQLTMRMIWEDVTADSLVWRWQARQPDGGWQDRWVLRYRRRR
jgi:hypothetical protein